MYRPILLIVAVTAVGFLIAGGCPPATTADPGDGTTDTQGQPLTLGTNPLPSAIEIPVVTAPTDTDGDGLSDTEEAELGTSVTSTDTDGDSLSDKFEVANGLNPKVANPLTKITRVECQACIVTEGDALWFSWSVWTDAFKGWKVGQRVYAQAADVDTYLYNVAQTFVVPTLSRSLGARTGSGTIESITTENDVPVKLAISSVLWTIASTQGSNLGSWAVGDHIVYANNGGEVYSIINTQRNEYITATKADAP